MSTLFSRVRDALAPTYVVEREVAHGGMAVVFRARDVALDRTVAIKVIRPELATARVVERFTREARLLANLNHPRIVPVYGAGEAAGLFYFVMPFIEGETLASRLERGALSVGEVRRIGLDILDALGTAHDIGIVHRDVSARNIFLVDGRAVLADFGIALAGTRDPAAAATGTIGAMPPEQSRGDEVSPATDVYATGALLYLMLTGRAWAMTHEHDKSVWNGVPRVFARALRDALHWSQADRYPSAGAFAARLKRTRRPSRLVTAAIVTLVLAGSAGAVMLRGRAGASEAMSQSDLAILPFDAPGDPPAAIGRDLARIVALGLEGVQDLQVTPVHYAFRWADAQDPDGPAADYGELRARNHVRGAIVRRGSSLDVRVHIFEPGGRAIASIAATGSADALADLGDSIALDILRRVHPRLAAGFGGLMPTTTRNLPALRAFLAGERAFEQGAWLTADQHYRAAVAHDSTFMLAWWRLHNTWRWLPTVMPDPQLDLARLYRSYGQALPELDRLLIEALLTPAGVERLRKLEDATRRFPRDGYAAMMYGVEVWHRGPLSGIPQARALPILEQSVALNEFLAPAHENIAWAAIRLGHMERARRALDQLATVVAPRSTVDVFTPDFFEQAYSARFNAPHADSRRNVFFNPTSQEGLAALRFGVRAGLMVGLPETQRMVARVLIDAPNAATIDRANAFEALALAELMQGLAAQGLTHLDSAALLFASHESQLEAAAWRVLTPLLGWPVAPAGETEHALTVLAGLARQPATARRADWVLAVAEIARGNANAGRHAIERFRKHHTDEVSRRLANLLDALHAGATRDYGGALRISERNLQYDGRAGHGEPFARAVLHLQRARWREALGDREGADREWLWAENLDLVGWPSGPAQAAEIDWVFGVYALMKRAELARAGNDVAGACARLREAKLLLQGAAFPMPVNTTGCSL